MFKLNGWKKELDNQKDFKFQDLKLGLFEAFSNADPNQHILPEHTPISNQGSLSSCVSCATLDSLEILQGIQNPNNVKQLSRLFVYWNSRVYDLTTDKDEGTFIRNAFTSLATLGVCLETTWQYDPKKVFAQPPIEAYKEGDDNTINAYYKIFSRGKDRLLDIEWALKGNCPVVLGVAVGKDFIEYSGNERVLEAPSNIKGYHAIIITGFRKNPKPEFLIRNSWGTGWGLSSNPGHAWVSSNYIMDMTTNDLWVPTLAPDLII